MSKKFAILAFIAVVVAIIFSVVFSGGNNTNSVFTPTSTPQQNKISYVNKNFTFTPSIKNNNLKILDIDGIIDTLKISGNVHSTDVENTHIFLGISSPDQEPIPFSNIVLPVPADINSVTEYFSFTYTDLNTPFSKNDILVLMLYGNNFEIKNLDILLTLL